MSQYIKDSIKKNSPHFRKYKKYIEENDWRTLVWDEIGKPKSDVDIRRAEFDVQNQLALAILNRMKLFVKKAEGDHHLKIFKEFTKQALGIINTHTERADDYISVSDISKIEDVDLRASEIEFHNHLYTTVSKIDDTIASLNIKDDTSQGDGIEFWDNKKAPLAMHKKISKAYPEVQRRLDAMGIDFTTPPSNDMLLYMKDIPEWNADKHYWEQDKDTLQFYVNEYKKLESGIEIDGLYISGWQYYHMNIFTTQYPIEKVNPITKEVSSDNVIGVPPFRDNEFWVMENFEKAKKTDKMLFLAATRRAAKTTMLASRLGYASTIGKLNLICAGGSTKDLDQIETNFKIDSQNRNTAFRIPNINDSWDKKVELGLKRKDGKSIINSILHVINLNKGGEKSSEILAGYTPDEVIIDEIMKLPFTDQLSALKPALDSPYGKRATVILSGTAGNEQLAKDAFAVLSDPTANDVLEMAWETLDSRVPLEYRTWKRRPFGTFIPGQMSAKQGLVKIDSNLKEYLKLENAPNLEKIQIKVTDWKVAKETIERDRDKVKKDHKLLTKETLYFPIDPEEMLLSSKLNPFPREYAVKHLEKIRQLGLVGKKSDVVKIDGKLKIDFSQKQLPKFPHIGGFHDAPVIFFEEPPEVKPPRGLYVVGLDDYKQEQSDTDSLGCFVVYKRQSGGDEWGDRIVAIYTSRPDPHSKFHKIGFLLAEAYNADVLMENEDMDFKLYLDGIRKTEEYLVPSFNLSGDLTINSNSKRAYGISPKGNKSAILSKVISYCNEELSSEDENGETITGIERVNDEMLLEEIINYKDGANHDRITTFGIALIMAHKLNSEWVEAKLSDNRPEQVKKTHHIKRVLGGSRRSRLLG